MTSSLKVGIIGVGGIARLHVPGWMASEDAELVAGCDVNGAVLEEWGETHGIQKLYTNAADLFNDPEIDIVDICVPNMYHAPLTIAALDAGKHVLCEKPLAPTPKEIRRMIEARDRSGKQLMTAQHFRFKGVSQAMKREIEAGALGDIYHARSWMLRRNGFMPSPSFTSKKHSGGGATIDIGVHVLDLTLWLMGNPKPVSVTGTAKAPLSKLDGQFVAWFEGAPLPSEWDVEEFSAAFVRFENDATLMLEVSWLLHHDTAGEDMQIWLYGTEGGSHWPKGQFLASDYQAKQMLSRTLDLPEDALEARAAECVAFARAIAEGAPSPVQAEQSLQVLSILDGIYRSNAIGREVTIEAPDAN